MSFIQMFTVPDHLVSLIGPCVLKQFETYALLAYIENTKSFCMEFSAILWKPIVVTDSQHGRVRQVKTETLNF